MKKLCFFLCIISILLCFTSCGKKYNRADYDDGPAIDNGTYGSEDIGPIEGDPYAEDEIGWEYALYNLERYYGFDSTLNKYAKFEYTDNVNVDGINYYRFRKLLSDTENGDYTFNQYVYCSFDGSSILFNKE